MTVDFGRRTRRRPIERDYAAAKDAEVGNMKENGSWNDSIADFGLKEYGAVKSKKRLYLTKK
jgi:hypothetical protein